MGRRSIPCHECPTQPPMRLVNERWVGGRRIWVLMCPQCGAIRAISDS